MVGFVKTIRYGMAAIAAILCASLNAATIDASLIQTSGQPEIGSGKFYGYQTSTTGPGDEAFANAYDKAIRENVPLIVIWSNEDCHYCDDFVKDLNSHKTEVSEWLGTNKAVFAFFKDKSGDDAPKPGHKPKACYDAWDFLDKTCKSEAYWPLIGFYFRKANGTELVWGHKLVRDKTFEYLKLEYAKWTKKNGIGIYKGGDFGDVGGIGHRYEAEESTESTEVKLMRDALNSDMVWTNRFEAVWPDGELIVSNKIVWSVGQTSETVRVSLLRKDGQPFPERGSIALSLYDDDGLRCTNHIALISGDAARDSAANPKWIGESFDFGEWTADLVAATNLVAKEGGVCTIVSLQGSRWCPDCANVDRNFLDLKKNGINRFKAWAFSNKVALVSIDIPNFIGSTAADFASPSLLSRKAYRTTLARVGEWPESGAEASLTNAMLRSGLGYLSRKGVDDETARVYLERNHSLVSLNTDEGGFHRPEDMNRYRTGVPIFVVLRRDGTVAARLTRMASVSPKVADRDNFDAYIKRFEEMVSMAADVGFHSDVSEIANNHSSTTPITVVSNGGSVTNEICHADFQDVFRLDGAGGGTAQKVSVIGESDAEVRLTFFTENEGVISSVATISGKLSDGVELNYTFSGLPRCFVQISGIDTDSVGFDLAETKGMNFHRYVLSTDSVLVPTETTAMASVPEGFDYILMRVTSNVLYRVDGIVGGIEGVFENESKGFYRALVDGDVRLPTLKTGGSVEYQIWNPGEIKFSQDVFSVFEYSVSGIVSVVRHKGASGPASVRIVFQNESYTDDRFDWNGVELSWADGESGERVASFPVYPNGVYDEDSFYILNLEPQDSCSAEVVGDSARLVLHDTTLPSFGQNSYIIEANLGFETEFPFSVYNISNASTVAVGVKKGYGNFPAGLKFSIDEETGNISVVGVPSKPGVYKFIAAISEKRSNGIVKGYETEFEIVVRDRSDIVPFLQKKRKNQVLPLYAETNSGDNIVVGILNLAVTRSNKISAKYSGTEGGCVSFSGFWQTVDEDSRKVFARLKTRNSILNLTMHENGTVVARLTVSPELSCFVKDGVCEFSATSVWPQDTDFKRYEGNYNVTFPNMHCYPSLEPTGTAYLALKMTSASSVHGGVVRYAGWLPDGTATSGTAKLLSENSLDQYAVLPIFRRQSRNIFSAALTLSPRANIKSIPLDYQEWQAVNALQGTVAMYLHRNGSWEYLTTHTIYGSYYIPYVSPLLLTSVLYGEGYSYKLMFNGATALPSEQNGDIELLEATEIALDEGGMILLAPIEGLSFAFSPMTGVFSGKTRVVYGNGKSITGYYRGILIPGWIDCGCGLENVVIRPLGSGVLKFRDKIGRKMVIRSVAVDLDKIN